ncbi:UPF0764 protein C16orf89 homolog isoform X2 [Eriocheir sinensis]|uniref:UPF0764 protein C16orf89 homolog isoform X2 n=1 Tax=Eriocheir sinensis TaxID=95602 RepID=UPI0021CAA71F|nr:UPF0764 protein C16orf89 homolog isoform X2 [Eriocheir sinensis]
MLKLPFWLLFLVAAAFGSSAQTRPLGIGAEPGGTGQAIASSPTQPGSSSLPWLLRAAVTACQRVLAYYGRHAGLMNLDALLGTRIAEGQFHLGLRDLASGGGAGRGYARAELAVAGELRRLFAAAGLVGDAAGAHLGRENRQYTGLLSMLQGRFWAVRLAVLPLPEPTHTPQLVLPGHEQLSPDQTDRCLEEVGGWRGCVVTKSCWDLMTAGIYSGYSLTHQVLYLIAGVQAGCGARLDHLAVGEGIASGVSDILARMCSAVLAEAREISKTGFPDLHRDLFMEQGALCGMLGYHAFFPEAWVRRVLSWQRREGCFGDATLLPTDNRVVPQQDPAHRRVRRAELAMTSGCLAHRSAVALGYLAAFTRHAAANASAASTRLP